MNYKESHGTDLIRILKQDGVEKAIIGTYENHTVQNIEELKNDLGGPPWAARVIYNELFGGVLIYQNPGEGNRLHYHSDADECWVIFEGQWEWYIEGEGKKIVGPGDIVVVQSGVKHKITCIGVSPGVRLAITRPDVDHIHVQENK